MDISRPGPGTQQLRLPGPEQEIFVMGNCKSV